MSIAADQPSLLAAVEDLVQQLLTRWLVAQDGNGARRATNAQQTPMQRLQYGRLDRAREVVVGHLESVSPPGVTLALCLADIDQPLHATRR
jgi:hypothetical protein